MSSHPNENRRSYDLVALGLVDGPAEPAFESIAELTAQVLSVPIVLLKITDHRKNVQRVRAAHGLPELVGAEVPTTLSPLCQRIDSGEPVVAASSIELEPGAERHGIVSRVGAQSLIASPLLGPDDQPAGALIAIDRTPRIWGECEKRRIVQLADLATQRILLRAALETVRIMARTGTD